MFLGESCELDMIAMPGWRIVGPGSRLSMMLQPPAEMRGAQLVGVPYRYRYTRLGGIGSTDARPELLRPYFYLVLFSICK